MIDPTRVSLARRRQGLTRASLASVIGVTTRTLTTWERDGAPHARLADLAAATEQPEAFFLRPALQDVLDEAAFFRARRRASASLRHRSLSLGALATDFYSELDALLHLPDLRLETADPRLSPVQAARDLRVAWELGSDALPNLVQLAESKGIRVLGLPVEAAEIDAFSFWAENGRPYVLLSRLKTPERSRFDLAHELGHLVMHGSTDGADERTDRELEREADVFAAELLMPESTVRALVPAAPSIEGVFAVKRAFGVSARAAARAAHDAGRLTEWGYRQLQIELSRRGFHDGEPGSSLQHERSRVFQVAIAHLRGQWGTVDSWARSIGQRPQDVAAFMLGQVLSPVRRSPEQASVRQLAAGAFSPDRAGPHPPLRLVP